jgi:hypothetical protein
MYRAPSYWKDPDIMSHHEFVLAYESGSLGCGVSTSLILRLFFTGKIRERKVLNILFLWTLVFLVLIIASGVAFLHFPVLWVLPVTIVILAIYLLAFYYLVGDLVLSAALANEEFYEFVKARRALTIHSLEEEKSPNPTKAVPIRRARRAHR